ncbi:MAG: hypothetical protein IH623_16490 [Verrucomicrobia bacterium]|nr:hypothetical protein [Verrucomicrobiota bacterium]
MNIVLNKAGPFYINMTPAFMDEASSCLVQAWGSFDSSTNQLIQYPGAQIPFQSTQGQLRLWAGGQSHALR